MYACVYVGVHLMIFIQEYSDYTYSFFNIMITE